MAVLGQNFCTPARIYGPPVQTIFCGCSVQNFSVTAGWNEQSSSLTVNLAQDDCVSNKVWWDENLVRTSGEIADPGFLEPEPGVPVYFRIEENPYGITEDERGGFEYCGIVTNWSESSDANGNPLYSVQLSDPRVIIDNVQLIVNEYQGDTFDVWNLINVYGYIESLGTFCPSAPADGIGGSTSCQPSPPYIANSLGMVWEDVRAALHNLISAEPGTSHEFIKSVYRDYCRDGRIVYLGQPDERNGYGILAKDDSIRDDQFSDIQNPNLNVCDYLLDLSEIPFTPLDKDAYRITGPTISLSELISQVCGDAGCDYYVELSYVKDYNQILKFIKVRVANRTKQPNMDLLDDFISSKQAEASAANGGVISYTKGEEVRNEPTSHYIIGDNRRDYYVGTDIAPYFLTDDVGNNVGWTVQNGQLFINIPMKAFNAAAPVVLGKEFLEVAENVLAAAACGDQNTFLLEVYKYPGDLQSYVSDTLKIPNPRAANFDDGGGGVPPLGLIKLGANNLARKQNIEAKALEMLQGHLANFANGVWGTNFLIPAPACIALDFSQTQENNYRYNILPSQDAWVSDDTVSILGLAHNTSSSNFFRNENGTYQAFLRYPVNTSSTLGNLLGATITADAGVLNNEEFISDGNNIWVRATINDQFVFVNGVPHFHLTTADPLIGRWMLTEQGERQKATIFAGREGPFIENIDAALNAMSSRPWPIKPVEAFCPYLDNTRNYGPWGTAGLPGKVKLEVDRTLNPWSYGSDTIMERAGNQKVQAANMRKGERGSITVAGFPNIPIGAELFSVDSNNPPVSQGNQKYLDTRIVSDPLQCTPNVLYINVPMNEWVGDFGPNVTNINVNVGQQGFTTTYQFNTFSPVYGRFEKGNAEKLKIIGQQRLATLRNMTWVGGGIGPVAAGNFLRGAVTNASRMINWWRRSPLMPRSSHHTFIGKYVGKDNDRIHNFDVNLDEAQYNFLGDTEAEINDSYSKSAISSFDLFFTPVSKAGDGNLPRLIDITGQDCEDAKDTTDQPDPPVGTGYTRLDLQRKYLDSLANSNDDLPSERDGNNGAKGGHSIEILGRTSNFPQQWTIRETQEETDYRFHAFRGPLIIQQWGYDLHGKPVPNKADTENDTQNGTFVSANLQDKFLDRWLQKPKTWPVAPLDLRLDRERGVWVTPQPPRIIHVDISGNQCPTGTGQEFSPTNLKPVYDANGSEVSNPKISAEWPWGIAPSTGIGKAPVYYDNVDCKHYIFPVNKLDIQVSGTGNASPERSDVKKIVFGSGFVEKSWVGTGCERVIEICTSGISSGTNLSISGTGCLGDCVTQGPSLFENPNGIVFGKALNTGNSHIPGWIQVDSAIEVYNLNDGACGNLPSPNCSQGAGQLVRDASQNPVYLGKLALGTGLIASTGDGTKGCLIQINSLGMTIKGMSCGEADQGYNSVASNVHQINFTSGLEASNYNSSTCSVDVTHPMTSATTNVKGQTFTHDKYGDDQNPPASITVWDCAPPNLLDGLTTDKPIASRQPIRGLSSITTAHGIGHTACGDCGLVLFLNQFVLGFNQACSFVEYSQVYAKKFSKNFIVEKIKAGSEGHDEFPPGDGVTGESDGSLSVAIDLNYQAAQAEHTFIHDVLQDSSTKDVYVSRGIIKYGLSCAEDQPEGHSRIWFVTCVEIPGQPDYEKAGPPKNLGTTLESSKNLPNCGGEAPTADEPTTGEGQVEGPTGP